MRNEELAGQTLDAAAVAYARQFAPVGTPLWYALIDAFMAGAAWSSPSSGGGGKAYKRMFNPASG